MSTAPHLSETERLTMTSADLAMELGISQRHLHTLNKQGKVPAPFRLGVCLRWPRSEIEAWLAAGAPPREEWETLKVAR